MGMAAVAGACTTALASLEVRQNGTITDHGKGHVIVLFLNLIYKLLLFLRGGTRPI